MYILPILAILYHFHVSVAVICHTQMTALNVQLIHATLQQKDCTTFDFLTALSPPRWPGGKASASRAEDPEFESRLRRDFLGSSHTSDSKIGTPVATLPGAWRYRVSAGTGRPGVSILWLGEVESLICNFYLSVAARKIVWADPSLRYTSMLLGR